MKGYIHKIPSVIQFFSKDLVWNINKNCSSKNLYLTFDDGPHPQSTPIILDCLRQFNAKATFFCQGNYVAQYPSLYQKIIEQEHQIGNHTYDHISGWKSSTDVYCNNVEQCAKYVSSNLFRPPYGQITRKQIQVLKNKYYIIMYNIISGDFDSTLSTKYCYKKTIRYAKAGDIILFHDNLKSISKVQYLLSSCLDYWSAEGFTFESIYPNLIERI